MKVWIVADHIPYEGYGEPHGVFSSSEKAEAYIATLRPMDYGSYDIFEMEVDSGE
jgi:hypothetical protein